MFDLNNKLLLAVPKKGRLSLKAHNILKEIGLHYLKKERTDIAICSNWDVAILFLPAKDIPTYVAHGDVDLGITGLDNCAELNVCVTQKLSLGFGSCRLCLTAPKNTSLQITKNLTIATSYPYLTKQYFKKKYPQTQPKIIYLSGSVEIANNLRLADMIVDLVDSGSTIQAMELVIVDVILQSEAVLISNPHSKRQPLITQITQRIQGVRDASIYALIEYNILRSNLKLGEKITPGSTSPTILPLENSDWVAVKALVKKQYTNNLIEQLAAVGAKDILVYDIKNCRVG